MSPVAKIDGASITLFDGRAKGVVVRARLRR
jgi:hypothetical protein